MNTVVFVVEAVLNTLWQSAIVAGAVWTALQFSQSRLNAATRYVIWWITLVVVLTLPWIHRPTPRSEAVPRPVSPSLQHALPALVAVPFSPPVPEALITVTSPRAATWPLWVFAVCALVSVWHVFRMAGSYFYLRGVKRRAALQTDSIPFVRRKLQVLLSTEITSPMAAGFLSPVVLIPAPLRGQLTPEEFQYVVLHECAHLARYDDWLNVVERTVAALATLHPVVWFALRRIAREREVACDDWVVARTGAAQPYAEALVRIAELRIGGRNTVLASGIFSSKSRLRVRVEMLVRDGRVFSAVAGRRAISVATLVLACFAATAALAPHWIALAQRPEFEVASVRENTDNGASDLSGPRRSGQLFIMHNTRIFSLVNFAYDITATYQVDGYDRFPESWKWYDVSARIPDGATDEQIKLMVQSLLADRFKFKTHREKREITQYALVVDGRAKLTAANEKPMELAVEGRRFSVREGTCGVSLWQEGARWACHAVSIDKIVATAGQMMKAPVVDRTGLRGKYDVNLRFITDDRRRDPDAPFGPSFEQALREELGLRLEKGKGEIEVLVIDHMEKPSEN